MTRLPDERERIFRMNSRRERERLLYESATKVLSFQTFSAAKAVFGVGISSFFFAWSLGQLGEMARWVEGLRTHPLRLPGPASGWQLDFGSMLPSSTSTLLSYGFKLPVWDWRDALLIALVVMIFVFAEKAVSAFLSWRHVRSLAGAIRDVEEEIRALRRGMGVRRQSSCLFLCPSLHWRACPQACSVLDVRGDNARS